MFVCNHDRKKIVNDYIQKYVEITEKCLWIEIADERLQFLQTKHLQCTRTALFAQNTPFEKAKGGNFTVLKIEKQKHVIQHRKYKVNEAKNTNYPKFSISRKNSTILSWECCRQLEPP